MMKSFHSLLILAFIAAGFADIVFSHAAVKSSPSHSTRQIKAVCKSIQLAQEKQCQQEAKQLPKQQPVGCETLHCNFHHLMVGQSNVLNHASLNENHSGFIEKQPFILQLKTSKRPPRFLS